MKKHLLYFLLLAGSPLLAQTFTMCNSTSTTNTSGTLYDSGGPTGDYQVDEDCGFLINPGCATSITLSFSQFDVESGWDFVNVYDGTDNNAPLLVSATGNAAPVPVTASSGTMYVEFTSDGIIVAQGFTATWTSVIGSQSPVTASFTPSTATPGYQQPVTFTDNSTSSPTQWLWDFGDGNTSTSQNPTHTYSGSGAYNVTLTSANCSYNDMASQVITVQPPTFYVNPDTIVANLTCGNPGGGSFMFYNTGASSVTINVENSGGMTPLDSVRARVNRFYPDITAAIPSMYSFSEGVTGNNIGDGGNDMYDGGNFLSTNFANNINYSNNLVVPNTAFGTNGAYFTLKVPGLFVLGADIDNVSSFNITGNLGADGSGNSDGSIISRTVSGVTYRGFINRTYNAFDPSINRLIIVQDNPAATHTFLTSTNDEDHEVLNLNSGSRMYYLLFAATSGLYLTDAEIGNVMDEFLNLLNAGASMTFTPNTDVVPSGDSSLINFTIDITGLLQGTYERTIRVNVTPGAQYIELPVIINVAGTAIMALSDSCITFPQLLTKEVLFDTVSYTNSGCDTLNINGVSFDNGDYTMVSQSGDILPGQVGQIIIQFRPTIAGTINGNMTISTNVGDTIVCLSGIGLAPPITFGTHPDTLFATIPCGNPFDTTFVLYNSHSGPLTVNLPNQGGETSLDTLLARVNRLHTSITSLIPSMYPFTEGVTGNNISDGGNDMYDGGNFISTNLTTNIPYSDNLVVNSNSFGAAGRYFTRKVTGLFVLGADIDNLTSFNITGNLGADGSGNSDGSIISRTVSGHTYTGFINRTYNAFDPSINRLIIVQNIPAAAHTFLTSTNDEDHEVTNLNGGSRIYYLLFAGASGIYIDDTDIGNVMDAFLALLDAGPAYTFTPSNTTIASGDSVVITASIDITGLYQGTYNTDIEVIAGAPFNHTFIYPAVVEVIGSAVMAMSDTCIQFPSTVGGNPLYDTIFYTNTGCDTLQISTASIADPNFTLDSITGDLLPGQTGAIVIRFDPIGNGTTNANMTFTTNISNDPICLSGTGQNIVSSFTASGQNFCTAAIKFTDASLALGGVTSWAWDFGDGNTSTQQSPTHTYASVGTYTVTLVVCNSLGCDTSQKTVNANFLFLYDMNVSGTLEAGSPVNFAVVGANIVTVTWDFGDGSSLPGPSVSHTFADTGTYTVTASVLTLGPCYFDVVQTVHISTPTGLTESISNDIMVYPNPTTGVVSIRNEAFDGHGWSIEVVNTLGEIMYVQKNVQSASTQLNLALEAGVYTLRVTTNDGNIGQQRLIIRK